MEEIILLDTGIILDFFGGKSSARRTELILAESRSAISAITVYELFNGVTNKNHIHQLEQMIKLCEVVGIDVHVARKASTIYTNLKKNGQLTCNEDILIASCALHKNYPLYTTNQRHYKNIQGLTLY